MILRKTDNKCDKINQGTVRVYNKYHISNTIGIALVGVDFKDSLDNGGRSIKIFSKISNLQG